MGEGATRIGDEHTCTASTPQPLPPKKCWGLIQPDAPPPKPHVGGPLVESGSGNVKTNNKPAVRTGDVASCANVSGKNVIVTGAAKVKINGQLAVRIGSLGVHKTSTVTGGSTDVKIGGDSAGATFGDAAAAERAKKACEEAARNGRGGEGKGQGKDMNCGMESVRQLCLQKCAKDNGTGPGCKLGKMDQDEMYKHYLETHGKQHNELTGDDYEERKKKYDEIYASNEKKWATLSAYPYVSRKESGGTRHDPGKNNWQANQGYRVYAFKSELTNVVAADELIEYLPAKPMPPVNTDDIDGDAKKGEVGSYTSTREAMLKECGIESHKGENKEEGIAGDLATGGPVLAIVDVGNLPAKDGKKSTIKGTHTVTVTSMEYDDKGNLKTVTLNDTSADGRCGWSISGDDFNKAVTGQGTTNAVNDKL